MPTARLVRHVTAGKVKERSTRVFQRARVMHLLQLAKLTAVRRVEMLDDVVKSEVLYWRRDSLT